MTAFGPEMEAYSLLATGVRRLVAPNPSMMTGPGTNTYLLGGQEVAVLDPGPLIDSHIANILSYAENRIRWIIVTHTHPDHSPAAAELARVTGAQLLGRAPPAGEHQDTSFVADRIINDGDEILIDGTTIEAICTPGHASNHVCYWQRELNWVFTGDHVIDGSTVVINPPDGDMTHYLQSLSKVRHLRPAKLAPGHGELIDDPDRAIDWIIQHRLQREEKVLVALVENPLLTSMQLVPHVYKDVDSRLYGWAERSLLAHLLKLNDDGVAKQENGLWILR